MNARATILAACLLLLPSHAVPSRDGTSDDATVRASVRVYLNDGSALLFADGFRLRTGDSGSFVEGEGRSVDRLPSEPEKLTVPVARIYALEYYDVKLDEDANTRPSDHREAAARVSFRSSPNLYTYDDDGRPVLEAEAFSTSYLRRLEAADLDRLDAGARSNAAYSVLLTNEALETQYINMLNLVAVDHAPGYEAFPTRKRGIVLFGEAAPLRRAT